MHLVLGLWAQCQHNWRTKQANHVLMQYYCIKMSSDTQTLGWFKPSDLGQWVPPYQLKCSNHKFKYMMQAGLVIVVASTQHKWKVKTTTRSLTALTWEIFCRFSFWLFSRTGQRVCAFSWFNGPIKYG